MKKTPLLRMSPGLVTFLFLLLYFIPIGLYAQTVTVKGTVKDQNGQSVSGVSITQKGTANVTLSGIDGSFSLTVPDSATLIFSHVGFNLYEAAVNGRTVVDVTL